MNKKKKDLKNLNKKKGFKHCNDVLVSSFNQTFSVELGKVPNKRTTKSSQIVRLSPGHKRGRTLNLKLVSEP